MLGAFLFVISFALGLPILMMRGDLAEVKEELEYEIDYINKRKGKN